MSSLKDGRRGSGPEPAAAPDPEPFLFAEMGPITATEFRAMTRALEARFAASKVPAPRAHSLDTIKPLPHPTHHTDAHTNTGYDLHLDLCNAEFRDIKLDALTYAEAT